MDGYDITIQQFMQDISTHLPNTLCNTVPLLGYDGMTPGPLIIGRTGVQDVTRFTNNIPVGSKYFPAGGPGDRGGEGAPRRCPLGPRVRSAALLWCCGATVVMQLLPAWLLGTLADIASMSSQHEQQPHRRLH